MYSFPTAAVANDHKLKTTPIGFLIVLEVRSPKLVSLDYKRNVGRVDSFWGGSISLPFLLLV